MALPLCVLTDGHLLKRITSFVSGVPYPVYAFWLQHKPDGDGFFSCFFDEIGGVVDKIVAFGTLELVERATQVRLPRAIPTDESVALSFGCVVDLAIQHHRPDMLEWGLRYSASTTTKRRRSDSPRTVWHNVITNYCAGDTRMLDVLKRLLPLTAEDLEQLFSLQVTSEAAKSKELITWLIAEVPDAKVERHLMVIGVSRGDLDMVTCAYNRGNRYRNHRNYFGQLYRDRNWELLAYLLERDLVQIDHVSARAMVESDDARVQQFVRRFQSSFQDIFHMCIDQYVNGNDVGKLQSLLDRGYDLDFPVSVDSAAANGLEVIKLIHERGLAITSTQAMDVAAHFANWAIVDYLHEHNLGGCSAAAMDAAGVQGNLKYVAFFLEKRSEGCSTKAMDGAAARGHLDVVRFLHENTVVGCTTDAMDAAAKEGHLDVVKFLHTHRSEGCTVAAMNEAARYGLLHVVDFLHTHRSEGCTTDAMDEAAKNGHLDVVKFLHAHRSEGCTSDGMDKAAEKGHLDVVEFLHTHRSEGCTADAVKFALAYDHKHIVRFLWTHYSHLFGPDVLHNVLLRAEFDIFLTLRAQFPAEADTVLSEVTFDAGMNYGLQTIRFIVEILGAHSVAYRAMDGAACADPSGHVHWMRAVFAVTGTTSCRLSAVRAFAHTFNRDKYKFVRNAEDALAFIVHACCEDGAKKVILSEYRHRCMANALENPKRKVLRLHPFLKDPRTPTWAIRVLLGIDRWHDPYYRLKVWSWAVDAVTQNDTTVLEMVRDLPANTRPRHNIHGEKLDAVDVDRHFSFEGARVAAVCRGNLPMLQWLIEHVDLPIEPTLLSEAVYYHRYDMAVWLAAHCPDACREMNWDFPYVPSCTSCGLDDGLLDWLARHDSVRSLLDFGIIIDTAASWRRVESLRTLYGWYPQVFMARPTLIALARRNGEDDPDVIESVQFLRELGYTDQ